VDKKNYYDQHGKSYITTSKDADLTFLYDRFLSFLPPPPCKIVDGGCGSGRDMFYFKSIGYEVEGFDSSEYMVHCASSICHTRVRKLSFEELEDISEFDGFWACASLLHVPRLLQTQAFASIWRALKPQGVCYCSYKNQAEDYVKDGRSFTCFTPQQLRNLINEHTNFSILDIWETLDASRTDVRWTNALLKKS